MIETNNGKKEALVLNESRRGKREIEELFAYATADITPCYVKLDEAIQACMLPKKVQD